MKRFSIPAPVRWSIGLIVLGVVAFLIDWSAVAEALRRCRLSYVAAAFGSLLLSLPLSVFKWDQLLRVHGERVPLWQLTRAYLVAFFVNHFLPTGIGGDVHRVTASARYTANMAVAAMSVLEERAVGLLSSFAVGLGCGVVVFVETGNPFARLMVIVLSIALLVSFVIALVALRTQGAWGEGRSGSIGKIFRIVGTHVTDYEARTGNVLLAALGSVLFQANRAAHFWLLCAGLGAHVGYAEIAVATAVVNAALLLPITFGGLGTTEASFVGATQPFGVASAVSFAAAILLRVIVLPSLAAGAYLFAKKR